MVAGFLEIGHHDFLGIGIGIGAGLAELFGRPEAEQLVAPRGRLEPQFLVEGEFALEAFFAVLHAAHGIPPDWAIDSVVRHMCVDAAQTKSLRRGQYRACTMLRCGISRAESG